MNEMTDVSKTQDDDEKSLILFLIIAVVMITALVIHYILFPPLTLEEATLTIIQEHPECLGEIEVEERESVGYRGSYGIYDYAVCKKAGVSIRIRQPQ